MRKPRLFTPSISLLVGAAVLFALIAQKLSSAESEMYSEAICWTALPILHKRIRISIAKGQLERSLEARRTYAHTSSLQQWIVAAAIAVVSLYKAGFGPITLFPALTPLLLLSQKHCGSHIGGDVNKSRHQLLSFLGFSVTGTVSVALLSIYVLHGWDFRAGAYCIIALVALLVIYVSILRTGLNASPFPSFIRDVDPHVLSVKIVVALIGAFILQVALFGAPTCRILPTVFSGVSRSLSWYFSIEVARHSAWHIAAAIATFSILAISDPSGLSTESQAIALVIAACLSLTQVISMVPGRFGASVSLWLFALFPLTTYLINEAAILAENDSSPSAIASGDFQQHPVEALIQQAHSKFQNLTQTQSKTLKTARAEYRRRYAMDPPPGFDLWYNFAASRTSRIIDNFDTIHRTVSPLLSLSGAELNNIISEVHDDPKSELWLCHFSGRLKTTHCRHAYRSYDRHISTLFDVLLKDIPGELPDLRFLVNHLDEPRVLLPDPTFVSSYSRPYPWRSWKLMDTSHTSTWEILTKGCTSQLPIATQKEEQGVQNFGLPFVRNASEYNLCQHPEYKNMHGLLLSPTSMKIFEGIVPILSTGSLSTMGDILYPSPAYIESEFTYSAENDLPWEKKSNKLYWTGSNTGGWAADSKWRCFHRQRFVELVHRHRKAYHYLLRSSDGLIRRIETAFLNGRSYSVSFTRVFQCKKPFCYQQRAHFGTAPWDPKDQALKSRLAFDIDGNGISGRFYKLLASRSVPLKQTLLREWHDDRLVPWMHYVPVSQSMDELPELVRYLTTNENGLRRAKEIADQGREWFSQAFRQEDLSIYVYRLFLELARLQDPYRVRAQ